MKKTLLTGLAVFSVAFTSFAYADESKIAIVNFQEVVKKSPEYEAVKTKLEKQFTPKQKKLLSAQDQLKKDIEDLQRNNAVMKDADKKKLQEKIIKQQQDLQAMEMTFQKEYVAEQETAFQTLIDQLKDKVGKIAKAEKLDLVLSKDAVAYTNGPDITSKVIKSFKKK